MNKFRERLILFIEYFSNYTKCSAYVFMLSTLLFTVYFSQYGYIGGLGALSIMFILLPCVMVHLIESKEKRPIYDALEKKSVLKGIYFNIKKFLKHYIMKYLKFSLVSLFSLILSVILLGLSSMISIYFIVNPVSGNMGEIMLLMVGTYLMFEGFSLTFNSFATLIIYSEFKDGLWVSIKKSKRLMRKNVFKHLFQIIVISVFFFPIIMISDLFAHIYWLSFMLRAVYIVALLNYVVFDIKQRLVDFDFSQKTFFQKISKGAKMQKQSKKHGKNNQKTKLKNKSE